MKTSFPVAPPVAIFADPARSPPPARHDANWLGDLLGKASAHVDWLASHGLYGERFCPVVERRVTGPCPCRDARRGHHWGVSRRGIRVSERAVESGIAMAMIGNSDRRVAVSTTPPLLGPTRGERRRHHTPHGFQVATRPTSRCACRGTRSAVA